MKIMSKADRMFEKLGWVKVDKPQYLNPTFSDVYSEGDSVYEFYFNNELRMRFYFIDKKVGFSTKLYAIEEDVEFFQAVHEKLKELGLIEKEKQ